MSNPVNVVPSSDLNVDCYKETLTATCHVPIERWKCITVVNVQLECNTLLGLLASVPVVVIGFTL